MIDRDERPLEFSRVLSLSDAVFGLAMTLLVVSIAVPPGLSPSGFSAAVGDLGPRIASPPGSRSAAACSMRSASR